ncbi:MAG TPA: allantoinase AllB [Phycisphaerae bacterium]|nr:allantoinase AllB [Phycisphaerae bacterium]
MAAWDTIIRGGSVITPDGVQKKDIAISDGRIVQLAAEIEGAAGEEIDANGLTVFPGLIDPHVHFNEPGRTEWEGFSTGSSALAAGGGTCFFDMPLNASPPTLDGASFDTKRVAAEKSSWTDFALWGGLTPGNLDSMEELAQRGVIGFKAFMCESGISDFPYVNDQTLRRGMGIAARLGLPVAVHAEDEELISRLTAEARAAGRKSVRDYLNSRPIVAEVNAIHRAIGLAEEAGCSLHIVHISSAAGCQEVASARDKVDVTGETCPHYLALTDADMERLGAAAKCAPPLRDSKSQITTLNARAGIDFIASDHSPAPASMKESSNFFDVWGGVAGIQSTRSILLSLQPRLPIEQVGGLTATNAAARFKIPKGSIVVGADADLALVDSQKTFTLQCEHLLDRNKFSPYIGRKLRGEVKRTILRGRTIFNDGRMIGRPGGRLVTRR